MVGAVEPLDGPQIGENKSSKAPVLAQNRLQQEWVVGDWNPVDFVVGGHHRHGVPLANCFGKGRQHHRPQFPLADMDRRSVGTAFGRTVAGEMFRLGHDRVVAGQALPLRTSHIREAHLSGQVGILAEILFHPSPAGITGQIQHRSQDHVHTR